MLDQTDRQILAFLKEDGRMPFLSISKKLNVSESTIRKRVKKLTAQGIIRAFTVSLGSNLAFQSIIAIKCKPKATKTISKKIQELNSLMPVFEVTGRFDIFCIVSAPTSRELNKTIDKIRGLYGVIETESFLIVEQN